MPLKIGERVPPIVLARLEGGVIAPIDLERTFAGKRAIVIGVPGAFTPVCTKTHVPEFIDQADKLRDFGFQIIMCVAPNDPWVVEAWAEHLDPMGKVAFVSDGNLELARALGVNFVNRTYYFGERSQRYLMVTRNAVIESLSVETNPIQVTCTSPDTVLLD